MKRTEAALRSQIARRIIKKAYGIDPKAAVPRIIRYELIGEGVAVILLHEGDAEPTVGLHVAQRLPSGRIRRLRKASRAGVRGYRDVLEHLEALYVQYGSRRSS
jgi:hypothetical protein